MDSRNHLFELTVIVPVFNEAEGIAEVLDRLVKSLRGEDFRLVVVDDGSRDKTTQIVKGLAINNLTLVVNKQNQGKGSALAKGLSLAKSHYVAYIDGDLDLHPEALVEGLRVLRADNNCIAAYGSKVHPDSIVNYPPSRRLLSSLFRYLTKQLFSLDVGDTQTGLKIFRTSDLTKALLQTKSMGWIFDLELTYHLLRDKTPQACIREVPVKLDFAFDSNVGLVDLFHSARDVAHLYFRINRLKLFPWKQSQARLDQKTAKFKEKSE